MNERSAGIDLLRCFSVLLVVFSHYGALNGFFLSGTHGVAIFFMVSGYCMSYSTQGRNGRQFLLARFWRLVPTLILCASITALIEAIFADVMPDRGQSFQAYLANLVCLPMGNLLCDIPFNLFRGGPIGYNWVDGAYWSLLVEIRFYVLLCLLYYVLRLQRPALVIATLGLLAPFGFEFARLSKGADFLLYLPFFAFGMAYHQWAAKEKHGLALLAVCFLVFVAIALLGSTAISMNLSHANVLSYGACFLIFVAAMHCYRNGKNSMISFFGLVSYPLYLLHQDIGLILIALTDRLNPVLKIALVFAVVLAAATLVNLLIERYQPVVRGLSRRLVRVR